MVARLPSLRSSVVDWRRQLWELRYRKGPRLASELRRVTAQVCHGHARVEFHGPVRLGPGFALDIPEHGTFIVGRVVDFRRGFVCEISGEGRVEIGAGSIFTSHTLLQCTTSITIGERCMFGQSTLMADGNHRFRDLDRPMLDQGYEYQPIVIEDDVTVTTKCTIIGAHIGTRSVIGANSVVVADIRPTASRSARPPRWSTISGRPSCGRTLPNGRGLPRTELRTPCRGPPVRVRRSPPHRTARRDQP